MEKQSLEETLNILLRFTPRVTQNLNHKEIDKIRKILKNEDNKKDLEIRKRNSSVQPVKRRLGNGIY